MVGGVLTSGWNWKRLKWGENWVKAARKTLGRVEGLLVPMIDARRMEVYTTLFDGELNRLRPIEAMIIDAESFASELNQGPLTFFGHGA